MAAPKNNHNGKGNKGGGRKSAFQERADADLLWKMFFGELSEQTILKKVRTGKYSLKDVFVKKGFDGNERILSEIFRKLFPDNVNLNTNTKVLFELEKQTKDILASLLDTDESKTTSN